jgi:hypothetical protein
MAKAKFSKGETTFTCTCCGRGTRNVDQALGAECCTECWELAGIDNQVNDDGAYPDATRDEAVGLLKAIAKKGGDAAKSLASCSYLAKRIAPEDIAVAAKPKPKKKVKAPAAKVSPAKKGQKPAQAALVRQLLSKKVPVEKIVERVQKACGGKPTVGYVNWIARKVKA